MRFRSHLVVGSPTLRAAAVMALTAVLLIALAGAVIAAASLLPSPAPEPPEPISPTWVTGNVQPAPSCSQSDPVADGDVFRTRDIECSPQTWTSDDPRLTGEVARRWNVDTHQTDEGRVSVGMDVAYLHNEGGGWSCSNSYIELGAGMVLDVPAGGTFDCVGGGGYAGLSAILFLEPTEGFSEEFVGLIFSGGFPPVPEAPAAQ